MFFLGATVTGEQVAEKLRDVTTATVAFAIEHYKVVEV